MNKINKKFIEILISENIISWEEKEYWTYRLELVEGKIVHFIIIIINYILSKEKKSFVLYVVCFILLRKFAGGYHAKTKCRCVTMTIMVYFVVNILLSKKGMLNASVFWDYYLIVVIAIFIGIKAPIIHPNLALDIEEKLIMKKYLLFILTIEVLVLLMLKTIGSKLYISVELSIGICAFFIIIVEKKGECRKNEKKKTNAFGVDCKIYR